jgi:hypothetical protein
MRARLWICAGLVVALMGCSSVPSQLDRQLRPYVGRNITAVSAILGDPESERPALDETQFTWTVDNRFTIRQSREVNLDDVVKAPYLAGEARMHDVPMHYMCSLRVLTDRDGIIKTFHATGNEGCQRFVAALNM